MVSICVVAACVAAFGVMITVCVVVDIKMRKHLKTLREKLENLFLLDGKSDKTETEWIMDTYVPGKFTRNSNRGYELYKYVRK